MLNYILLLGWSPKGEREIFTLPEMIGCSTKRHRQGSRHFDPEAALYQCEYIRAMSEEAFSAEPYIDSVVRHATRPAGGCCTRGAS
ncbi:MAG: hypothetical protein ACLRZH_03660 [Ruthenibacterium lactatiformans]